MNIPSRTPGTTGPASATAADEDAAAVLVILTALAAARPAATTVTPRSVWGRPSGFRSAGPDAWWASGLPQ